MANMGVGNKPLMDIGGSNTITDRSVSVPDNSKHHFEPVHAKNQPQKIGSDPNLVRKIRIWFEPDQTDLNQAQKNLDQIGTSSKILTRFEPVPKNVLQMWTRPKNMDQIQKSGPDPKIGPKLKIIFSAPIEKQCGTFNLWSHVNEFQNISINTPQCLPL